MSEETSGAVEQPQSVESTPTPEKTYTEQEFKAAVQSNVQRIAPQIRKEARERALSNTPSESPVDIKASISDAVEQATAQVREEFTKKEKAAEAQAYQYQSQQLAYEYVKNVSKGKDSLEGFSDVFGPDLQKVGQETHQSLMNITAAHPEHTAELAYYYANNPRERLELENSMADNRWDTVRQIVDSKVNAFKKRKESSKNVVSQAPEPLSPIKNEPLPSKTSPQTAADFRAYQRGRMQGG